MFLSVVSHLLSSYKSVWVYFVNKVLLPCVADKWHSVCENGIFLFVIPSFVPAVSCVADEWHSVCKSGVFLFVIPSFVREIFKFLHYANLITDDIISRSSMKSKHKINNISANNRAMQLKLGTLIEI